MKRRMRLSLGILCGAAALVLLGANSAKESKDGIDVFFRDTDLNAVAGQDLARYPETDAGDASLIDRAFPDAPPVIPHTVEDMLPITREDNECLNCHHPENADENDIPVPDSHFSRAVMAKAPAGNPMRWVVGSYEQAKDIVGARYNCSMCHTPQAENARVLESRFVRPKLKTKKP